MRIFNSLQLQLLLKIPTKATKPNLYMFSSLTKTATQIPNTPLSNYLIETLNLPKTQAQSISTQFSHKSLDNPHSVLHYFRSLGFSETDIRSAVGSVPKILFSNVDKTLKPKIDFFLEMGLVGSHLGKFISNNTAILTFSLSKKLIPRIENLKKILVNDKSNEELIKVISRCSWVLTTNPESRLLNNTAFLESCGIVGSQLSVLLKRQPSLFVLKESKLRDLVSRVSGMGFSLDSGMSLHALHTLSALSEESFERKFELFRSFGFTEDEFVEMFRRAPVLPRASEKKLKLGMKFFLNKIDLEKEALIKSPRCLMLSLEERVIPRYKVMQILKSKRLLKNDPSFINVLNISEKEFLRRFVSRFRNDAEELLVYYKGHLLDSLSSSPSKEESP
ncbi:hypothetical protein ACOSQ2_022251 [Xanthoceras sorbifolium]